VELFPDRAPFLPALRRLRVTGTGRAYNPHIEATVFFLDKSSSHDHPLLAARSRRGGVDGTRRPGTRRSRSDQRGVTSPLPVHQAVHRTVETSNATRQQADRRPRRSPDGQAPKWLAVSKPRSWRRTGLVARSHHLTLRPFAGVVVPLNSPRSATQPDTSCSRHHLVTFLVRSSGAARTQAPPRVASVRSRQANRHIRQRVDRRRPPGGSGNITFLRERRISTRQARCRTAPRARTRAGASRACSRSDRRRGLARFETVSTKAAVVQGAAQTQGRIHGDHPVDRPLLGAG